MSYWILDPEASPQLGESTVLDTATHPPGVKSLELSFRGWLGDDLMSSFPVLVVTRSLAARLGRSAMSGFEFSDLRVSTQEPEWSETMGTTPCPELSWLTVHGAPGVDDFGLVSDGTLVVSSRALELLREGSLNHCEVLPLSALEHGLQGGPDDPDLPLGREGRRLMAAAPVVRVTGIVEADSGFTGLGRDGQPEFSFTLSGWRGEDGRFRPGRLWLHCAGDGVDLESQLEPWRPIALRARLHPVTRPTPGLDRSDGELVELLAFGAPDPELEAHARYLSTPFSFDDPDLGTLALNRSTDLFTGSAETEHGPVTVMLSAKDDSPQGREVATRTLASLDAVLVDAHDRIADRLGGPVPMQSLHLQPLFVSSSGDEVDVGVLATSDDREALFEVKVRDGSVLSVKEASQAREGASSR